MDQAKKVHRYFEEELSNNPFKKYKRILCIILNIDIQGNKVQISQGTSYCSPKDRFNRKLGKKIAYGRANLIYEDPNRYQKRIDDVNNFVKINGCNYILVNETSIYNLSKSKFTGEEDIDKWINNEIKICTLRK